MTFICCARNGGKKHCREFVSMRRLITSEFFNPKTPKIMEIQFFPIEKSTIQFGHGSIQISGFCILEVIDTQIFDVKTDPISSFDKPQF